MKLPIEVGDKVRIVCTREAEWGGAGEVGDVKDVTTLGRVSAADVSGVGVAPRRWWQPVDNLELFADELEDMPPDTHVTFGEPHLVLRHLGGAEAVRRFRR